MMMTKRFNTGKLVRQITVGLAASIVAAMPLAAKELRLASGLPPMHPAHDPLYTDFKELIAEKTDGEITGRLFGPEVATLSNMRTAIHSGMIEVGIYLPAYFPADLPEVNLFGDLSMLGSAEAPHVTSAALSEYNATCADCQSQLKDLKVVYLSSHSNPYNLLTTKPVTKPEDLKGLRLRVATPQHSRWVEAMGATPVSLPVGETFEALSQGIIEGSVASISDIISFNLDEVISDITMLDMGTFHSMVPHAVSTKVWEGLTLEQRDSLLESSVIANTRTTERLLEMVEKGKERARAAGIEIHEPSAELVNATEAFVVKDLELVVSRAKERNGIENAGDKVARFQALVEKWTSELEGTEDPEAVANAIYQDLSGQLDLNTYGL